MWDGIIGVVDSNPVSETSINQCYSIGENIKGTTSGNAGTFVGGYYNTTFYITNSYYLNTTGLPKIGINPPTTDGATAKSLADFQKSTTYTTASVAYLLQQPNTKEAVWEQESSKNNGFPYLVNNLP